LAIIVYANGTKYRKRDADNDINELRGLSSHFAAISKCLIEKKAELPGIVMKSSSFGKLEKF